MTYLTQKKTLIFNQTNKENGWLSLWSPHGIKYNNNLWPNCAHAWYGTRWGKNPNKSKIGALAIKKYEEDGEETQQHILEILEEILIQKINTHKILKTYLSRTGDSDIIFLVSKYDTTERKWLGITEDTNVGDNRLGKLWMKIREGL